MKSIQNVEEYLKAIKKAQWLVEYLKEFPVKDRSENARLLF